MKLTTTTMVTLDGVMQGLGGPDEDRSGGFSRGAWIWPFADEEGMSVISQSYERANAFLFGRRTFDIFAGSWGTWEDPGDSPIWIALNTRPKYVASTTLTDPQWANTTVITGEFASAIRELKAQPGGELAVPGSGVLIQSLLAHDLVDEMTLLICPVVLGQGKRLFPDGGPDTALELTASRVTPSGVTIQTYRPNGRAQFGMNPDDSTETI